MWKEFEPVSKIMSAILERPLTTGPVLFLSAIACLLVHRFVWSFPDQGLVLAIVAVAAAVGGATIVVGVARQINAVSRDRWIDRAKGVATERELAEAAALREQVLEDLTIGECDHLRGWFRRASPRHAPRTEEKNHVFDGLAGNKILMPEDAPAQYFRVANDVWIKRQQLISDWDTKFARS